MVVGGVNASCGRRVRIYFISHSSSSMILDKLSSFMIHGYVFVLMLVMKYEIIYVCIKL